MPNYGDPALEKLGNGRTMSDLMRGGPKGIRGVIVSPSTPGGIPVDFDPHDRSKISINIEPDGPNSQAMALDRIRAADVSAAIDQAREAYPSNDINSIRERAAMAFEQLAKLSKSNAVRVPVKSAAQKPVPKPEPTEHELLASLAEEASTPTYAPQQDLPAQFPPLEKIDRTYSPMAAFGLKKQPATSTATPAGIPAAPVGPPKKLLYFEKEGIGTVPAFFHDVIVNVNRETPDSPEESGFLVLVYDLRFEHNVARWFPPADDPYERPWAVQINNDARLYLVYTTGFQYVYDNREHCVLRVERALWLKPSE